MGVSGNMAISSPLALVASLTIYPESKCTNDDDTEQGPAQLTNHEQKTNLWEYTTCLTCSFTVQTISGAATVT